MNYLSKVASGLLVLLMMAGSTVVLGQCAFPGNCSIPPLITVCPTADIPVSLVIRDINNVPCPGETITMNVNASCLCATPTTVTSLTNIMGVVTFLPQLGGCCTAPGLVTYTDASGVVVGTSDGVNSPDMSGDCRVNLSDVAMFSGVFFGSYSRCADFNVDGVLNLSDIGVLALHLGH